MATYLELVKITRRLCGMQGTGPSSVANAQGVEEVLVQFVNDAYVDIQNMREDWKWMEASGSFSTQAGKDTYSLADIFLTPTPDLKKYQKDSFLITDSNNKKTYLRYISRNALEAKYLNSTSQRFPTQYTIDPPSNSIILKDIPDGVYSVSFRYQKAPSVLESDTEVPAIPAAFHNLIAYKATEKMAVYLGIPELFRQYSFESSKMLGQLMRLELPKLRMKARPLV